MKSKSYLKPFILGLSSLIVFTACEDNTPEKEDVPELITKVTLTFTPVGEGSVVVVSATDPDGEGLQQIEADGIISLDPNTEYNLAISMFNTLLESNEEGYDITEEVEEEGAEHQLFFEWSEGVFANPTGTGNIESASGIVNYTDEDENGLPIGLATNWTSVANVTAGAFRIVLKHQPELKSATSGYVDGETDVDLEFNISIE